MSAHLDTEKSSDSANVIQEANEKLKSKHGIHFITIQVTICLFSNIHFNKLQKFRKTLAKVVKVFHFPHLKPVELYVVLVLI